MHSPNFGHLCRKRISAVVHLVVSTSTFSYVEKLVSEVICYVSSVTLKFAQSFTLHVYLCTCHNRTAHVMVSFVICL